METTTKKSTPSPDNNILHVDQSVATTKGTGKVLVATEETVDKLPGDETRKRTTRTGTRGKKCVSSNNQAHFLSTNEIPPSMKDKSDTGPGDIVKASVLPGSAAKTATSTSNDDDAKTMHANEIGLPGVKMTAQIKSKKKQKQLLSDTQKESIETKLLNDIATTMSKSDRDFIYKQCQELLSKISEEEKVLSMEEILEIIQDWKPKQEILCLYVRIARKLPANFHLDSISTLLCISKQCGYNPVNFLTKTKCLQITPSGGKYGFSFMFKTISNKTIDGNTLDRKFVGLSLTLTLLEQTVSNSCGVIARDGMRSSTPREAVNKVLDLDGSSKVSFKTMPSNEFHKRSSLINRLWLAINHRWMSFHLVEQLFICKDTLCENDAILVYSFMMHASCGKSRYQFLDPMVGMCFRFQTREDIEANRPRLNDLWQNPSNFLTFGNYCLQRDSKERKIQILVDMFKDMKSLFTRTSSYGRAIDNDRRWLMLRAYICLFWLKRESNTEIRSHVESALAPPASNPVAATQKPPPTTNPATKPDITRTHNHPKHTTTVSDSHGKRRRLNNSLIESKLWSPVNSSHDSKKPATTPWQKTQATINQINRSAGNTDGSGQDSSSPFCPISMRASLLQKDWSSIQLMTQSELDEVTASYLLVHAEGGLDILSKLSPLEVYSADRLKDFRHSRLGGPPGYQPCQQLGDVVLHIGSGNDEYLDKYSKLFHVARQRSVYFKEHKKILPSDLMFANLCRSILKYGNIDNSRSKCQYRVNLGCGGQHFPDGVPATLIGKGFVAKMDTDNEFDSVEILSSIGLLVEFVWRVSQDMQRDVCDAPLAPDPLRWNAYARHLCNYLFIADDVGFEDITLVISPLTNNEWDVVSEHTDVMNDNLGGYSRTCVFNTCFSLEGDVFLHMQVIGNFRRTVRQYIVPFEKSLQSTIVNGRRYIASWQSNMQAIFAGVSTNRHWDPFDRSHFFLDDDLPFTRLQIYDGTSNSKNQPETSIYGDYLLTEIGLSRMTSLSMFIDPISRMKDELSTDQRIELAFFASFLSNPFWFHYSMEKLIAQNNHPNDAFTFGIHPMYDVIKELYSTFGTWQGGPHNRWSPCGGAVPVIQLFGAHPSATHPEQRVGMEKLEAIVEVLFCHLEWVNSLKGKVGANPLIDLPLSTIQLQWESIRKQVYDIIPCQFSLFRLSIFTTIVTGCNELLSGPHLKQIMIPLPGTSSFKHLLAPSKGQMSKRSATDLAMNKNEVIVQPNEDDRVTDDKHDRLMLYLSNSFGRKRYVRDEMECLLCESHPGRNLDCRDWFCKGQNLFDCSDDGIILMRPYGKNTDWKPLGTPKTWSFKFLKRRLEVDQSIASCVYYKVDESIANYALSFGIELRQFQERIIFSGRSSIKSKQQSEHYDNPFLHRSTQTKHLTIHHYRSANMFSRKYCNETRKNNMVVLGNGEKPKSLLRESNTFESFANGITLLEKVRDTMQVSSGNDEIYKSMVAGCYHQEIDDGPGRITYFPGHLDKCYIHNVWFVPLSHKNFFTFVAVPSSWKIPQDVESNQEYMSWLSVISHDEQKSVQEFHDLFKRDACKFMKQSSITSLVFSNKLGSLLQVPPNCCFHATIIPAERSTTPSKSYRDLLIFHPLVTM